MRVAVVGHVEWVEFVLVDRMPVPGDIAHASTTLARAAGGGGVAAAVLADLGAEVDLFCAFGQDPIADAAVAQLTQRGVAVHAARRQQPTRRAVTLLDGAGERTIVTIGERLEPLGSDELEWERLREASGVYVTAGDEAALVHAREARMVVATPRARHALSGAGPPIDALVFSGRDEDERAWATRVQERARLMVATDGPSGGRWWGESEGSWDAVPAPGPPRDSYGCGDSFAAGFTFALAGGRSVAEAAALGARLGAECLTRVGAP